MRIIGLAGKHLEIVHIKFLQNTIALKQLWYSKRYCWNETMEEMYFVKLKDLVHNKFARNIEL